MTAPTGKTGLPIHDSVVDSLQAQQVTRPASSDGIWMPWYSRLALIAIVVVALLSMWLVHS